MNKLFLAAILLLSLHGHTQELFSMTEPASNMAARSIAVRADHLIMDEVNSSRINYHLIPGIRVGVSKKLMISSSAFFSNRLRQFKAEGAGLYAKYRFLSHDAVQKHFRMSVFAQTSFNNSDIHQEEINLYGHNTGFEAGLVATQLLKKLALSSTLSYVRALDNGNNNKFLYGQQNSRAINHTISIGKLMLPRQYSNYQQTNINLMLEMLSQLNTGSGKYYIDMAPSVQFIFSSQGRIDIGYKKLVSGNLARTAPNGFFVRLEYNFFNVL